MEKKTGRDYIITALKRKHSDRLPTTVLIGPYCSRMCGYTVREILTDAKKSAEAHLAFYRRYQPDSVIVYNDIFIEAEALGCELDFPEDQVSHPKTVLLKDKSELAKLAVPDPQKDGRLPYYLELCDRVRSELRQTAPVGLGHSGPWNLAMHLRGTESLLMDTIEDPDFVHDLMKFTTEVVRTIGDTMIGAKFSPSIGEAYASCSLISPTIYRDFIKPYHAELNRYFLSKGASFSMHICGFIDPIMEDIIGTGMRFLSMDAPSSLRKMVELSAGRIVIEGNVPTTLFSSGTHEEMEAAIRACVDTAAAGSGYILASGCEIPLNSTEDRIEHFFRYGHQYAREFISRLEGR
jgi:uroporphyrinogen decarboxylase